MHVDQKGLGMPPVFSGKEVDFYVSSGALSFAVESQDVVTAAAVPLGVPERDHAASTERDGQLFVVSALMDGDGFDVVTSAGGDRGFESCCKLHRRWDPHRAGRGLSFQREILSPPRAKLLELITHTLVDDIRMC